MSVDKEKCKQCACYLVYADGAKQCYYKMNGDDEIQSCPLDDDNAPKADPLDEKILDCATELFGECASMGIDDIVTVLEKYFKNICHTTDEWLEIVKELRDEVKKLREENAELKKQIEDDLCLKCERWCQGSDFVPMTKCQELSRLRKCDGECNGCEHDWLTQRRKADGK